MGLTVSNLAYSLQFSTSVTKTGFSYCGTVGDVDIEFGAEKPIDIYISSTIAEGSCDDRVTVHHELQHVSFIEQAIMRGSVRINATIYKKLQSTVFNGTSQEDVVSQAKKSLISIIDRELSSVTLEMNARHASIDTPEAYLKTSAICRRQ